MKIKSKRGISLVALLITILVMAILSAVVVLSAKNSVDNTNVTDFMNDLQKIQDAAQNYYMENGVYPFSENLELSQVQVLEQVGADKRAELREEMELNNDYSEDGTESYYIIDLSKIDVTQTKRGVKKSGNANDVYIIAKSSGNVYYLDGLETKDNTYFSITEKAVKLYSINEPLKDDDKDIEEGNTRVTFDYNVSVDDIVTGNATKYKDIKNGSKYGALPLPTKSHKYKVSYYSNGGRIENLGDKNTDAIEEYTFGGWYLDSIFSTEITESSVLNITSNHNLYAKWIKSSDAYVVLPNVVRENYTFKSWYNDKTNEEAGGIGEKLKVDSDVMLVAKWEAIGFTLTVNPGMEKIIGATNTNKTISAPDSVYEIAYDAQGGSATRSIDTVARSFEYWSLTGGGSINSVSSNPVIYTYGDTNATLTANYAEYSNEIALPDATKEGYTFDGWYTTPEGGTLVGNSGARYKTNKNIKLYAHYIENAAYKVEHYLENANDDNFVLNKTEDFQGPIGRTVNAKSLSFDGYYYDSSVTGTISSGTVNSNGDLVLKLYYKRNRYSLTFTAVGGRGDINTPGRYKHGQTVEIAANPYVGCEFVKWTSGNNITIQEPESATTTFVMPKQNVTITANFVTVGYVLTLKPGDTTYVGNYGTSKQITAPTTEKYTVTFQYNNGDEDSKVESKKQFESWTLQGAGRISSTTANPVTYTYATSNDTLTANYSANGTEIKLPIPKKAGSTFAGWYAYVDVDGTQQFTKIASAEGYEETGEIPYIPTSDITLIAMYVANTYTVQVIPSDKKYSEQYGTVIDIDTPESEKYIVECNANGGSFGIQDGESIYFETLESHRMLKSWSLVGGGSIESYTEEKLTYKFGDSDAILTAIFSDNFTPVTLPNPTPAEGYSFDGWYSDEELTRKVGGAGDSYTPTSDITLYAKWKKNTYTLTIEPGSIKQTGEYTSEVQVTPPDSVAYTVTLEPNGGTLEESTVNSYKEFATWSKTGPGTIINSPETGWTFTFGAGDTTLTAKYSDENTTVSLPIPEKTGSTFEGWYSDSALTQRVVKPNEDYKPTSNITLYAKYVDGVARIGSTVYKTLADAIAAVPTNGTTETMIEILTNIDNKNATNIIPSNKKVGIDFRGYTLTSNTDTLVNEGKLTIYGGKIESKGKIALKNSGELLQRGSQLEIVESGTNALYNTGTASFLETSIQDTTDEPTVTLYNSGTLNLNHSHVYTVNGTAVENHGKCDTWEINISNSYLSNGSDYKNAQVILNSGNNANLRIQTGKIESSSVVPAIVNDSGATLKNGTDISLSLEVRGGDYGIVTSDNSNLDFEGGVVYGKINAIKGTVTQVKSGYKVTTERDNENIEKAYLIVSNQVNLKLDATAGGTVSGAGIKEVGDSVTVVATPLQNYEFIGWYDEVGALVSTSQNYNFVIPSYNVSLKAVFQEKYVYLTDATSSEYKIVDSEQRIYINGGILDFKIPGDGYEIALAATNSGASISLKNEGEESYKTVVSISPGETAVYTTTDECEIKISGIFSAQFRLKNSNYATIIDSLPMCNVNLYSPTSSDLYKTYQVKKCTAISLNSEKPTRSGYDLLGWSADPNSTRGVGTYYITQDTDLYAIWQIRTLYLEPNVNNYTLSNGNSYTGAAGSNTFVRLRGDKLTYRINSSLESSTGINPSIDVFSADNWTTGSAVTTIASGNTSINSTNIDYPQDMYLRFMHVTKNTQFKIGSDVVPLKHVLDGFESDGLVFNYDGRYSERGRIYSSSTSTWVNTVNNSVPTTHNLTRGGNYFTFNGTSSWVNLGKLSHDSYKDSFTLETVFKSTKTQRSAFECVIGNFETGGFGIEIDTNNKISATAYIAGAYRSLEAQNVYNGEITKASFTYDGSRLCLYINGVLENSLSITGEVKEPISNTVMAIGVNPSGSDQVENYDTYLKGNVYSASFYNKALTSSQIKSNYEVSKIHIYGLE